MADEMVISARWRFFVCSRSGVRMASLSRLAKDRKIMIRRNKADGMSFVVPADDPQLSQMMDDGFPLLEKQLSTIKGYRYEDAHKRPVAPPNGSWKLRLALIVWQIEDNGDENGVAMSSVTAYSPMILLDKMPVVGVSPGSGMPLVFDDIDAGEIIATIVDNANTDAGF